MPSGNYSPAKALRDAEKERKKPRGTRASAAAVGAKCGAKKRGGGRCNLASGWGTDHPGTGACRLHGGATPNHNRAAIKSAAVLMGAPLEINPLDALLWCVKICAGEVQWLGERMAELQKENWTEDTLLGKQFHLFARERRTRMNDLANYSKIAISLGIAERAVRLAEQYGETLARLISGILADLELTADQQKLAPVIVRKHLIAIEGGRATEDAAKPPLEISAVIEGEGRKKVA